MQLMPDKSENLEDTSRAAKCRRLGEPQVYLDENATLWDAIEQLVARNGPKPAVEDAKGQCWTYDELYAASLRIAAALSSLPRTGHQTQPVIAVLTKRNCNWMAACLAAVRLALPLLTLSADLGTQDEVARNKLAIEEHSPAIVVIEKSLHGNPAIDPIIHCSSASSDASPAKPHGFRPHVVYVEDLLGSNVDESSTDSASARLPPHSCHPDHVLYLLYTGGTTSACKCVAVTHRMAVHELRAYPEIAPLSSADRVLHQTSAFWGATSLGIWNIPWACGGCLVLDEGGAGPERVATAVKERKITVAGIVPSVLEALDESMCDSLRVIFTWGEALQPSTAAKWARRVTLLDLLIASEYWLILCAMHTASGVPEGFKPVPGAVITLLPPPQVSGAEPIDEAASDDTKPKHSEQEVPIGEVGELYLAGPMVSAVGYTDAIRNKAAFVDIRVGNSMPLRHFRTNDLARRRADGTLEYCGRADGFAKVGGKWLDLAALEKQLMANGCKEAVLLWDEQTKTRHAAVMLKDAVSKNCGQTLAGRVAELQRLLPKDTKLHTYKEFPRNPATGKVSRRELADWVAAASSTQRPTGWLTQKWAPTRAGLMYQLLGPCPVIGEGQVWAIRRGNAGVQALSERNCRPEHSFSTALGPGNPKESFGRPQSQSQDSLV